MSQFSKLFSWSKLLPWLKSQWQPAPPPIPDPPPVPTPTGNALLDEINKFRQSRGYAPYRFNPCLTAGATIHARDIAAGINRQHFGFETRANACGMGSASENEAWGGVDAASAVRLWSTSAGHLANMLGPYEEGGAAIVGGAAVMLAGTSGLGLRAAAMAPLLPTVLISSGNLRASNISRG